MGFSDDLNRLCEQAGDAAESVVRKTVIDIASRLVERSPVGDPRRWKANEDAGVGQTAIDAYAAEAAAYNAANPGKRRKGTSKATIAKKFPLLAGKGYVGGRFKSNWQYGAVSINHDTSNQPQASGQQAKGRVTAGVATWRPGQTIYVTNSLPYAQALEDGHSGQAPYGMVKLTVAEFGDAFRAAVAAAKK